MTLTSSRNIPRDVIGSERLRSATEHRDHESVLAVAGLPEEKGELLRPLIRASNGISVHSEAASARLGVATTLLRSSVEDESPMASRVRLLDRIAVSFADYLAAFTGLPEVRWQVNERMVLQLDGSTARFSVPNSAVVVFALLDEHSIVQLEVRNPAEMVLQYRTEHPGDRTDLAVGVKTQLRPDLWYVLPAALPMQLHTDQPGSSVLMVTARRLPDGTLNDGRGIDE